MAGLPPMHAVQAFEAVARSGTVAAAAGELASRLERLASRYRQNRKGLGQPLV